MTIQIRFALPNLEIEQQVHATGLALLNIFSEDLFGFIDESLKSSNGQDWLQKVQVSQDALRNVNFRDPSLLLKVLLEPHYPEVRAMLRAPINALIPKNSLKDFYDGLGRLLEDRNLWFHHEIDATPKELEQLAIEILRVVYKIEGLSIAHECQAILELFNPPANTEAVERAENKTPSNVVQAVQEVSNGEERAIGTPIIETFLNHSYTLHTTGEVRDRKSDILLSDQYPESSQKIGALLIARKPNGGRLKITASGTIAAYFNDYWGYLATVSADNWFNGHLEGGSK
jgi:hypothetical protein